MKLWGHHSASLFRFLVLSLGPVATFVLVFRYLIAHFYNGGYLLDSGVFAQLIWHNVRQLSQHVPTRESYYLVHVTPLLSLLSLISYAVPITKISYFCGFVACVSASYAALTAWVLNCRYFKTSTLLVVTVTSALSALSGLMLGPILYPHYEQTLCVAAGVFAYCLLVQRNLALTVLGFGVAILTREDGGLHVGLLLLSVILAKFARVKIRVPYRQLFAYLVIAVVASAGMIAIHKSLPNSFSSFNNAFADNWESIGRLFTSDQIYLRLRYVILERPWIWVPLAVAVLFALHFRDWGYLVGYGSNVPWFVLLITADYGATSTFSLYYGFPFIIGHTWALVWAVVSGVPRRTAVIMGLTLALGGIHPGTLNELLRVDVSSSQIGKTEAMNRVLLKQLSMPNVPFAADASVGAMIPDVVPPERIITPSGGPAGTQVILFSGCYRLDRDAVLRFAQLAQLYELAKVEGTEYYLAAKSKNVVKEWGLALRWVTYFAMADAVRCHGR